MGHNEFCQVLGGEGFTLPLLFFKDYSDITFKSIKYLVLSLILTWCSCLLSLECSSSLSHFSTGGGGGLVSATFLVRLFNGKPRRCSTHTSAAGLPSCWSHLRAPFFPDQWWEVCPRVLCNSVPVSACQSIVLSLHLCKMLATTW